MSSLLPYWVNAPLSPLADTSSLQPSPFAQLAARSGQVIDTTAGLLTALGAQRSSVSTRMRTWYEEQIRQPTEIEDWADAASDALTNVWDSGLFYKVLRPQYGGFPQLQRTLSRALQLPQAQGAPRFADTNHVGGLLMVFAGESEILFDAAKVLLLLMSGSVDQARTVLADTLSESAVFEPLQSALVRAGSLAYTEAVAEIEVWQQEFEESAANRLLTAESFPFDLSLQRRPRALGFEPKGMTRSETVNLIVRAEGLRDEDQIQVGNDVFEVTITPEGHLSVLLEPDSLPVGTLPISIKRGETLIPVGDFVVSDKPLGQKLRELSDPELWDVWHSVTVGESLNRVLPGVSILYDATLAILDATGQIAAAFNEAGQVLGSSPNLIKQALNEELTRRPDRERERTRILQARSDAYAALLNEVQRLTASVLVIPPCQGGSHQLNFALQQGLSSYAANAPAVLETDGTLAVFFCAGAPDPAVVRGTLNTVAQVLRLGNWPGL
jgi:hypothetical protein